MRRDTRPALRAEKESAQRPTLFVCPDEPETQIFWSRQTTNEGRV